MKKKEFLVKSLSFDYEQFYQLDCIFYFLILGVSCFRQIKTDKLINRKENDGTEFSRSSVQKSVLI